MTTPNTEKLPQEGELKPETMEGRDATQPPFLTYEEWVKPWEKTVQGWHVPQPDWDLVELAWHIRQPEIDAGHERERVLRESLANTQSQLAAASERERVLREALWNLVGKLELVHASEIYRSVWTINQIHMGPYTGPKYDKELEAAKVVLYSEPSPTKEKV